MTYKNSWRLLSWRHPRVAFSIGRNIVCADLTNYGSISTLHSPRIIVFPFIRAVLLRLLAMISLIARIMPWRTRWGRPHIIMEGGSAMLSGRYPHVAFTIGRSHLCANLTNYWSISTLYFPEIIFPFIRAVL
jgi:hypothetical protein